MRWIAVSVLLSVACDAYSSAPRLGREAELERRVKELEAKADDSERRQREMTECLDFADMAYWNYIKLNGREIAGGKTPMYRAAGFVWDRAARDKANAIEACKAEWK